MLMLTRKSMKGSRDSGTVRLRKLGQKKMCHSYKTDTKEELDQTKIQQWIFIETEQFK